MAGETYNLLKRTPVLGTETSSFRIRSLRFLAPVAPPACTERGALYGNSRLAGEFPTGITTVDGVPGAAQLKAVVRSDDPDLDGVVAARTTSGPDGTWEMVNLNPDFRYDVVGRKDGFNDVIVSNVRPTSTVRFTTGRKVATVARAFDYPLPIVGGSGGVTATLVSGTLPEGLTLVGNRLSGAWPTGALGEYVLVFALADGGSIAHAELIVELVVTLMAVSAVVPGVLAKDSPLAPVPITTSGGEPPYTFAVSAGVLPAGLSLSASGVLSGTPNVAEDRSFSVRVVDVRGTAEVRQFDMKVRPGAAHWRILGVSTGTAGGGRYLQLGEVMFGGVQAQDGAATASSLYSVGYPAASAFNGVLDGGWCSASGAGAAGAWVAYQYGSARAFSEVHITAAYDTDRQYAPREFKVQRSQDGVVWEDAAHFKDVPDWAALETRVFAL